MTGPLAFFAALMAAASAARYFRAAHGMDRVHSRWTVWDVRRTLPVG